MLFKLILTFSIIVYYLKLPQNIFEINNNCRLIYNQNNIKVYDNFYKYPNLVRQFALKQSFTNHNTLYHTMYSNPYLSSFKLKKFITQLEQLEGLTIDTLSWNKNVINESNGFFQYLSKFDKPLIHHDELCNSMIIYLDRNPKPHSGTSFFFETSTNLKTQSNFD